VVEPGSALAIVTISPSTSASDIASKVFLARARSSRV
jgi:hypothetical protein